MLGKKELSCGVIITDGDELLGCIPFGKRNALDIPKGHCEIHENPIECAIRETKEETGIIVDRSKLHEVGHFSYTESKDLEIFLLIIEELPDIKNLKCRSYFDFHGKPVPEMVGYKVVPYTKEGIKDFYDKLKPILEKVLEDFIL